MLREIPRPRGPDTVLPYAYWQGAVIPVVSFHPLYGGSQLPQCRFCIREVLLLYASIGWSKNELRRQSVASVKVSK
jgi:hypothetical protein